MSEIKRVLVNVTCQNCDGSGSVYNPVWSLMREQIGAQATGSQIEDWMYANGYTDGTEHEEIECYLCEGVGQRTIEFDLETVLADMNQRIANMNHRLANLEKDRMQALVLRNRLEMIQNGAVFEDGGELSAFSETYNQMMSEARRWRLICDALDVPYAAHHNTLLNKIELRQPKSVVFSGIPESTMGGVVPLTCAICGAVYGVVNASAITAACDLCPTCRALPEDEIASRLEGAEDLR